MSKHLTQRQRRSLVLVFKKVLVALPSSVGGTDNGNSPYICDNICRSGAGLVSKELAKNLIRERIDHNFSLREWLQCQSTVIYKELDDDRVNNQSRKLQAYRRAWLQSLIEEFSD